MTVDLGSANASIGLNYSGLESGIAASKSLITGLGGTLLGIAGVGVGIAVATTKMAGTFQESMTQLVTGAGESEKNIGMVSDGILSLATQTGSTTADLAAGMYMIESAGYHGAKGLDVLKAAAEGAKVGNASLADVANGVTTAMTDYAKTGLTAAQATNTLIATVAAGKTHMGDLANSLATILPVASSAGVGLNDVMGAMATMTAEGVPAAQAATYLRQTILGLIAPSAGTVKALEAVGLSSSEVAVEMKRSLPDALQMITDAVGKKFPVGSAEYVNALKNISGGSKTMMGMLDLTGDHLKTFQGNVANVAGTVQSAGNTIAGWNLVQGDFNTKMDQAREAVETLGIKVGTYLLPVVGHLFDAVTPLVTGFGNWVTSSGGLKQVFQDLTPIGQGMSNTFAGIVTAVKSPEFADFAGTLKNLVAPAFQLAGTTLKNIFQPALNTLAGTNVSTVSGDLRMAAESATVFVQGIQGFQDGSSSFEQAGIQVHTTLMQVGTDAQIAWGYIEQVGTYLRDTFTPTWLQMEQTFTDQVIPAWDDLTSSLGNMPALLDMAKSLATGMVAEFVIVTKTLATMASDAAIALGGVIQVFSGIITAAAGFGTAFQDLIHGNFARVGLDVEGAWTGIIDITRGALNIIDGLTGGMFSNVLRLFGTSMPQLTSTWGSGTKAISNSAGTMKNSVDGSFSDMKNNSMGTVQIFTQNTMDMFQKMGDYGTQQMQSLDQNTIAYWNDVSQYIADHPINAVIDTGKGSAYSKVSSGLRNNFYAEGVTNASPGWAVVGEKGPELMHMKGGEDIYPHGTMPSYSGSSSNSSSSGGGASAPVIHVHNHIVIDGHELSQYVAPRIVQSMRVATGMRN